MSLPIWLDVVTAQHKLNKRLCAKSDPPSAEEERLERGLTIILDTFKIIEAVKAVWPEDEVIAESFSDAVDEILFHQEDVEQAIEKEGKR